MKEFRSKEIYGDFYKNECGNKPLVVLIGGSRAGLPAPLSEEFMEYLKENYNVLLLAYFGVGQLNHDLEEIPIEYFINAITAVKNECRISDDKVIIIGQSKGGEAALVLTNYMQSAITIACVASCYVFQGLPQDRFSLLQREPKSAWSYNGRELPYIKFYMDNMNIENVKNNNFCRCHEDSIEKNFDKEAIISTDSYKGKILLISAENDKYWPSKKMSENLVEHSKNKNSISHVCLNIDGHYFLSYKESVDEMIKYLQTNKL